MKSALATCFNWKVLAGLGAVAAGLLVFAPGAAVAVLPLLLLLACPLSMGVMMFAMRGRGGNASGSCHCAEDEASVEAKRVRLAALREEVHQLQFELLGTPAAASAEPPAPPPASASPSKAPS